jgi:hypothetical protein
MRQLSRFSGAPLRLALDRFLASIVFAACSPVQAQMTMTGAGPSCGGSCGGGGGGRVQATAFLARVSNHTDDANYTTMICGMVTDGTWVSSICSISLRRIIRRTRCLI